MGVFLIQCSDTFLQLQIRSTSNIICNERVTDQIFLIFKRESNALVVFCLTRKIKLDWEALCWLCLGKGPQLKNSK